MRERRPMSKSVYVCVFHDLELFRYVLRCVIGQQLSFPAGMNKVYCYCYFDPTCITWFVLTHVCIQKSFSELGSPCTCSKC